MLPPAHQTFTAIDFETADAPRNSACAVGLVRVQAGRIVARDAFLIRPPFDYVRFTQIHGITWDMVRDAPTFAESWPRFAALIEGAHYLVAHNAPFDRSVLNASCAAVGIAAPTLPFVCTVKLARRTWPGRPARLPSVCQHLNIPLRHHDPASDAEACARILLAAQALQP